VGTFQDAGPLENDPLVSALSEVATIFPHVDEPDYVVSLGTGEPKSSSERRTTAPRNILKNGAFPRLCRLFWEKMRDKKVRQAFHAHPRYHRLDVKFDGEETRLDDIASIPELELKVQGDASLSNPIENVAQCVIAALFYFELDFIPKRIHGKYCGTGRIFCSIRRKNPILRHEDPAFQELFDQLSSISAQFYFDDRPIADVNDPSCFDQDGNFCKEVELNTADRFAILLKQSGTEPYNISGSPFSIQKLIETQGLDTPFGRADHRKRKASDDLEHPKKRRKRL
jgi:hypothetical protein